jgi:sugar phosphate isomerase/epimerase
MTTFELGINTCFAVKRWPTPASWAAVVRDDLGLDLVQHSFDLVDLCAPASAREDQAAEVRGACDATGLRLHSTFTGLAAYSSNLLLHPDAAARRRAVEWYGDAIDFSAACGAPATGGHIGAFSVADFADAGRRRALHAELREHLRSLARHARARGLEALLVENLASPREPATMRDIGDLVDCGDADHAPVVLCLDVGHQCVPGTTGADRDPYEWLRRWGARAGLVQLQQSDAAGDHHWPFTAACNAAGRIDADRVLDALTASGADAVTLVLEIIPPFEQDVAAVVADLVESVAYWRSRLEASTG